MRRAIGIASLVFLVAAAWFAVFETVDSSASQLSARFPLDVARLIEFSDDAEATEVAPGVPRREQLLDWLLVTAVSSADLRVGDMSHILYDRLPARRGYLENAAEVEDGPVRSAYVGEGRVVALLPAEAEEERAEHLAQVADDAYASSGRRIEEVLVFEYSIAPGQRTATLTRRPSLRGAVSFSPALGYREMLVHGADDLQQLLTAIDTLTYARLTPRGMVLGGRRVRGGRYRGVSVEDVAAVWQAESRMKKDLGRFDRRWKRRERMISADPTYRTFEEVGRGSSASDATRSRRMRENERHWAAMRAEQDARLADVRKASAQAWKDEGLVLGTGFSLDWQYDYAALTKRLAPRKAELHAMVAAHATQLPGVDVDRVFAALDRKDERPLLALAQRLSDLEDRHAHEAGGELDRISRESCFQVARYDGQLQGTAVGMTLFYTDLLSKVWGINFRHATDRTGIPGFIPQTRMTLALDRADGRRFDSTRTWFEPDRDGFRASNEDLVFSRRTVRVFSASSSRLDPGVETQPNASAAAFNRWWNRNYALVAEYEPEFERLNEIVKWSVVTSWLRETNRRGILAGLDRKPVDRTHWFPDWVRSRPDLRYRDWDAVGCADPVTCQAGFLPRAYKGSKAEALPLLMSSYGKSEAELAQERQGFYGGVTLSPRWNVLSANAGRAEIDAWRTALSNIDHVRGDVLYELRTVSATRASVRFAPARDIAIRGLDSEVPNLQAETLLARRGSTVSLTSRVGKADVGELRIASRPDRLVVGWSSRSVDRAQSLGMRISRAAGRGVDVSPAESAARIERVLHETDGVETAVRLPGEDGYLVRMRGDARWLRVADGDGKAVARSSWTPDLKVAHPESDHVVQFAWADDATARQALHGDYVLDVSGTGRRGFLTSAPPRGPPELRRPIEIVADDVRVQGEFDVATKQIVLRDLDRVPPRTLSDVQQTLGADDVRALSTLARETDGVVTYPISSARVQEARVVRAFETRDYRTVAARIVDDPAAYHTMLKTHVDAEVKRVSSLIDEGHYSAASRQLDEAIETFGELPDLTLRRGVVRLLSGDSQFAARTLNAPRPRLPSTTSLFDEIGARMRVADEGVRGELDTLGRGIEWNERQARGLVPPGRVRAYTDAGRLRLAHTLDAGRRFQPASPADVLGGARRPLLYVQDSPGLNNLDWHVSVEQSVEQAVSSKLGAVVKLRASDIGRFRPATIYSPDEATAFHLATDVPQAWVPRIIPPTSLRVSTTSLRGAGEDGNDDDEPEVFFVIATPPIEGSGA